MADDSIPSEDAELDERIDQETVMPDPDAPAHEPELPPEDQIEE